VFHKCKTTDKFLVSATADKKTSWQVSFYWY